MWFGLDFSSMNQHNQDMNVGYFPHLQDSAVANTLLSTGRSYFAYTHKALTLFSLRFEEDEDEFYWTYREPIYSTIFLCLV